MTSYVHRISDGVILGACPAPDGAGHVPQVTDYAIYGVITVNDAALECALNFGQADQYRVHAGAVIAATPTEVAAALPTVDDRRTVIDQATNAEDFTAIDVLLANFPAMVAAAQAGTFNATTWRGTLRSTLRQLRRKQKGV